MRPRPLPALRAPRHIGRLRDALGALRALLLGLAVAAGPPALMLGVAIAAHAHHGHDAARPAQAAPGRSPISLPTAVVAALSRVNADC